MSIINHRDDATLRAWTDRLIEQIHAWQHGEVGTVLLWLQRLGCRILSRPEAGQTWHLQGLAGSNATLARDSDPNATAEAIALLCAGIFWPQVFPLLIEAVATMQGARNA